MMCFCIPVYVISVLYTVIVTNILHRFMKVICIYDTYPRCYLVGDGR